MIWQHEELSQAEVHFLSQELGVSTILASLLLRIGIRKPEDALRFINPDLADLEDPFRLANMDRAVQRLRTAMKQGESLVIQGDYDVDGVTSTALLVSILRKFNVPARYFVARRKEKCTTAMPIERPDTESLNTKIVPGSVSEKITLRSVEILQYAISPFASVLAAS